MEDWTEIHIGTADAQTQTNDTEEPDLKELLLKITSILETHTHDLHEIKSYIKQQSIVSRMTLPFSRTNEPEFNRARFVNLAIRQNVPLAFDRAKTPFGKDQLS